MKLYYYTMPSRITYLGSWNHTGSLIKNIHPKSHLINKLNFIDWIRLKFYFLTLDFFKKNKINNNLNKNNFFYIILFKIYKYIIIL